jgi:hypothetical protein
VRNVLDIHFIPFKDPKGSETGRERERKKKAWEIDQFVSRKREKNITKT